MTTGYDAAFHHHVAEISRSLSAISTSMQTLALTAHRTALAMERVADALQEGRDINVINDANVTEFGTADGD
jgi:hypothetical protein